MTIQFFDVKRVFTMCLFALTATLISGCHRGEDGGYDDRTLAERPQVETVKPEDRKDIFRP